MKAKQNSGKRIISIAASELEDEEKGHSGAIAANVESILKELGEDPAREGPAYGEDGLTGERSESTRSFTSLRDDTMG